MNLDQSKKAFYFWLAIAMLFSVSLSTFRVFISGKLTYFFLFWNLALAFIPFLISEIMTMINFAKSNLSFWLFVGLWLIFFPNAPYILTDFFHIKPKTGAPFWYDLLMLTSYSYNGAILGFVSLMNIENIATKLYGKFWSNIIAFVSLVACSFGIYVGRYLRWNSWELFTKPQVLLTELQDQDFYPFSQSEIVQFTFGFSLFLIFNFLILKKMIIPYGKINTSS